MTRDEITTRFPNASAGFIRANLSADCAGAAAKLEPNSGDAPLAAKAVQGSTGKRFFVRITSFRKRLLDTDNLCEKYHVDLCRYAKILHSDAPGICQIEVAQKRAEKTEYTLIEVFQQAISHEKQGEYPLITGNLISLDPIDLRTFA